ncbi:prefoldin subunit alpha [Haloferacaceae archaeon DSL9]
MGGGGQGQLQQLSQELQAIDAEVEELEADIDDLETERAEMGEAIDAVETLESGSTVQVPLGGGAYLRAEVQDIDEVIVSLGGGYAAEQPRGDAVETLRRKQDVTDERISELRGEIEALEDESDEIEQQAQQLQQQLQQQQMQQMQQLQEDNDE